ncbi:MULTISPECIES: NAD kinase [unclassified Flavobacterium]|jgi:NAD+ kinase|uniref:NAD kinase n=1 Tax=unclassified Flavobacterium TaxID=196869 RepID=UPI00071011B8|nr:MULTISPECIES: NAD kinase [unclassified Flavobacterium]KRD59841.1 NAD kinase [Flavobacterium sp. Root935]MDQ1164241.1 NAD+ kinase [Flavobacterium sp. SORGH_AS_0622]TDX14155.1 NAD+ kinase [Flavobacterium sp. S87F.05.LMB.W.Kidney.N]BDU24793.1 NAD kinase [Flavobacterium sp. GSB-24]
MKIAIYGQYYQNSTEPIIKDIFSFFNSNNVEMVIEENFLKMLYEKQLIKKEYKTFSPSTALDNSFEMLISIGGDGTILRAAAFVRNSGVPLLGINAGRLGFLAKVQKENIDSLLQFVIDQNYTTSERTLLGLTSEPKNDAFEELNFAMNEVTVSRKDTTSMITVETYLNNEYLNSYWADGLIISTPTGSTGYSLSCGGPILTPDVKSLVITPIAPHNLTARPLVIPDDTEITLRVTGREDQYLVSLDSRISSVKNESILKIKKTDYKIKMVEIPGETFLKTLRNKLLWGEDKRN